MKNKTKKAKIKLVEITRSFKYPISMGQYMGTSDIFCSYKAECKESDAEKVSEALHDFCRAQVVRDVNKFLAAGKNEKKHEIAKEIVKTANDIIQGRSAAEKKDMKHEIRDEVMADIVQEELESGN